MGRRAAFFLLLLCASAFAFGNSFAGRFVFDDVKQIVENEHIRSLSPVWAPLRGSSRPLVQWSLALNFAVSGLEPWSYHLLNVLIHLAAACVLAAFLRRILAKHCAARVANAANGLALLIALLWLIHPLQTESVTYVIQRGESLMGLFCLLMLYCFIRSVESKCAGTWRAASTIFCILGLATKPIMAIAPFLVLIYDGTLVAKSFRGALVQRWRYYAALFGSLAMLPVILAGKTSDWAPTAGFGSESISPLAYAATQPEVILRYLRLAFWPDALCLDYGWKPETNFAYTLLSAAAITLLAMISVWQLRRKTPAGFAAACFFLTLAPTSSFIPIADLIYEHRMYLALAAVLSFAVVGAYLLLEIAAERSGPLLRHKKAIQLTTALIVTLLLTGRTLLRNDDYASDAAIWASALEISPDSPRPHVNLGAVFAREQRWSEAAAHFERAIEIQPGYSDAHYNLGNAQIALGHLPAAILSYRRALTLMPNDWQMHNNFGVALLKSGDSSDAAVEFERALSLNADCASASLNLSKIAQANE